MLWAVIKTVLGMLETEAASSWLMAETSLRGVMEHELQDGSRFLLGMEALHGAGPTSKLKSEFTYDHHKNVH